MSKNLFFPLENYILLPLCQAKREREREEKRKRKMEALGIEVMRSLDPRMTVGTYEFA